LTDTGDNLMPVTDTVGQAGHATIVARNVRLVVNGRAGAAEVEPRVTLLDFLRDRLGLTGTKKGPDYPLDRRFIVTEPAPRPIGLGGKGNGRRRRTTPA
jgi:hypothetical protein